MEDSSKKEKRKIAKQIEELRRICCEKKQIEQDQQGLMNCLCIKRGRNPTIVSQLLTQIQDVQNKVQILCQMQENVLILNRRVALERPTFPVNPLLFRVPGPCLIAILDCCTIHGFLRVLQETFLNDHLLKKDDPLQSSTFFEFGIFISGFET